MKKKQKGGIRPGAGRKPSGKTKTPITVYIDNSIIEGMGGLAKAREQIYCFVNGTIPLPADYVEIKDVGIFQPDGIVEPLFKLKAAPKGKKQPEAPQKGSKGKKSTQNSAESDPGVMHWLKRAEAVANVPENEPQPPEGLTGVPLMVWENEQKLKNKAIKPQTMVFGGKKKGDEK